jgi:hypothetical protein
MKSLGRSGPDKKIPAAATAPLTIMPLAPPRVRRRLLPEVGRALETLGHAIEYLADEYAANVDGQGLLGSADPRVEAIQILKRLNREVYYSGSEVPASPSRIRRWFFGA